MSTGADLLRKIQPVKRRVSTQICMRADVIAEFLEADRVLAEMKTADDAKNRMAKGYSEATKKQARKVRTLEKKVLEHTMDFEFESMGKDQWRALCDDNPPRDKNQLDLFAGYDRDAVLDAAVRVCLVEPVFETCTTKDCIHTGCGTWEELVSILNPSEWQELKDTVSRANQAVVDDPKSVVASRVLGTPNGTSVPRGHGGSRRAASTGGSRSSGTST